MVCHEICASLNRQLVALLLVTTSCLASCGEEDRAVRISCNHSAEAMPIHLSTPESEAGQVFQLSAEDLHPGEILRLTPGGSSGQSGSSRVIYALKAPAESYLPDKSQSFSGTIAGRYFAIEAAPNVESSVVGSDALIERVTYFFYGPSGRRVLRDAIAALNGDSRAVAAIREGAPTSRFLVVSGAWPNGQSYYLLYGSGARVAGSVVAVNTVKRGPFYLHAQFRCSSATGTGPDAGSIEMPHQALISYLPVRYDGKEGTVVLDKEPIDLGRYRFATSAPQ